MAKAVPLRATLSVESQDIVIHGPWSLVFDGMLKSRSPKTGDGHAVESPVGRHSHPLDNLLRGCRGVLGGEQIEHAHLVVLAKESPRITGWAIWSKRQGLERRLLDWHGSRSSICSREWAMLDTSNHVQRRLVVGLCWCNRVCGHLYMSFYKLPATELTPQSC